MSTIDHKLTKEQLDEINKLKLDTSEEGREKYQSYAIDAVIGLHTVVVPPPPPPPPQCPKYETWDDNLKKCVPPPEALNGIVKPGGWGANPDAETWQVVNMIKQPILFKVVDDKGINVATHFPTKELAERYILWYKWKQTQTGPPPPPPPPPGSNTTKDGVTVPFKIKGEWNYTVREDWRDGGARFNIPAAGTSLVMVGYFTASVDAGDEVSAKALGGRHSDSVPYDGCIYDLGIRIDGKKPRMRAECPHPHYTGTLSTGTDGITFVGRWTGMMASFVQETAGVRIQYWQDQGDAETKPANEWKKLYEFFDDGTKITGIAGADRFPLRTLPATAQNTWRIDNTPGLAQKWIAIAEIDTTVV